MNVRDVMTAPAASVSPETPLKEVARLLIDRGISGLPVVAASGEVLGVISEGDFLLKEAQGSRDHLTLWSRLRGRQDAEDLAVATTAGELMTTPALTIDGGRSLHAAASLMAHRKVNRLPVTEDGRLVGILTRADVVRAFVRTDAELLAALGEALRAVGGVQASVQDGVATLHGTVSDAAMAASVRAIAGSVDGIVAVEDAAACGRRRPPCPTRRRGVRARTTAGADPRAQHGLRTQTPRR